MQIYLSAFLHERLDIIFLQYNIIPQTDATPFLDENKLLSIYLSALGAGAVKSVGAISPFTDRHMLLI